MIMIIIMVIYCIICVASVKVVACKDGLNLQDHLNSWSSTVGDAVCGLHAEDGDASGLTCAQRFPNSKEVQDQIRGKIVGELTII